MTTDYERRAYEQRVELRAADAGTAGPGVLTGYGAVFNSESRDLGGFVEVIDPTAFATEGAAGALRVDIAANGRVIARDNHDSNGLLGTTNSGTLRLFVDDIGVRYEVDLPDTSRGRDVAVLAARGDYSYSSFAFRTLPDGASWRENATGQLVRVVTGATLIDVAPVADPAYWGSTSELVRSLDLDAVRSSLNPPSPAMPGAREKSASERAKAVSDRIKKESA